MAGESRKRLALFGVFYRTKQPDSVRSHFTSFTSDHHHQFVLCSLLRAPAYSGLLLVLWSRTDLKIVTFARVSSCWRARSVQPARRWLAPLVSSDWLLLDTNDHRSALSAYFPTHFGPRSDRAKWNPEELPQSVWASFSQCRRDMARYSLNVGCTSSKLVSSIVQSLRLVTVRAGNCQTAEESIQQALRSTRWREGCRRMALKIRRHWRLS